MLLRQANNRTLKIMIFDSPECANDHQWLVESTFQKCLGGVSLSTYTLLRLCTGMCTLVLCVLIHLRSLGLGHWRTNHELELAAEGGFKRRKTSPCNSGAQLRKAAQLLLHNNNTNTTGDFDEEYYRGPGPCSNKGSMLKVLSFVIT